MTDHVISGLIRRRRELTGDMLDLLAQVDALSADVAAIDRVLLQFDPAIQVEAIPALKLRPRPDWALKGQVVRIVLAVLKDAPAPLSTASITERVHEARGLAEGINALHRKRIRKCLERQRERGLVRSSDGPGNYQLWEIARANQ